MYRRLLDDPSSFQINDSKCDADKLATIVRSNCGDLVKVAEELAEKFGVDTNEKKLKLLWKTINPSFARGNFFLEEDGLLLATMELLRDDILEEGFAVVHRLLPWRHCTMWRARAKTLFSFSTSNWTM